MPKRRKEGLCIKCQEIKEIVAKGFCSNCYVYKRIRENPRALQLRRLNSLRSNRKISGIPLDAPLRNTNNQRIINNDEAWAIQCLLELGYEIRKKDKTKNKV